MLGKDKTAIVCFLLWWSLIVVALVGGIIRQTLGGP